MVCYRFIAVEATTAMVAHLVLAKIKERLGPNQLLLAATSEISKQDPNKAQGMNHSFPVDELSCTKGPEYEAGIFTLLNLLMFKTTQRPKHVALRWVRIKILMLSRQL